MGIGDCVFALMGPTANEVLTLAKFPNHNDGNISHYDQQKYFHIDGGKTTSILRPVSMNLLSSQQVLMPKDCRELNKLEPFQHNVHPAFINNSQTVITNNATAPTAPIYHRISAIPSPLQTHLSYFYTHRVETRRTMITKTLREVVQIAQELLHEVEMQEPRFISTLKHVHPKSQQLVECGGKRNYSDNSMSSRPGMQQSVGFYDGLRVLSPTRFEVALFLNQMGVFNFVDDGNVPGGAVLKLSDGRKRSMSLWVEFITASGYLSARKIRARFHSLVGQAVQKCSYRGILRMVGQTSEVKICIRERYILQITPAFRCSGLWPRSASHWPLPPQLPSGLNVTLSPGQWPSSHLIGEVKMEGFCLLSQESVYTKDKQSSAEGDAWLLDFSDAEDRLLSGGTRRQCLSILKTLADQHLTGMAAVPTAGRHNQFGIDSDLNGPDLTVQSYDLKTLVLHECEKHPLDDEWTLEALPDRMTGVLLQLISCLQHRRCPHYFLPHMDVFRGYSVIGMDVTARQAWCLLRELITCPRALEQL